MPFFKHIFISFFFTLLCSSISYGQTILDLQQRLEKIEGVERMDVLNQLSKEYINQSIDTSLIYAYDFLILAKESALDSFIFEAHYCLFQAYRYNGQPDSALVHSLSAQKASEQLNIPDITALSYSMIATSYGILADYDKKIHFLKKGIKIGESEKDSFGLAKMLYNLARVYNKTGDFEQALEAAIKAETLFLSTKSELNKAITDALVAEIYGELGQASKAKDYLKKALTGIDKEENPYQYADVLMGFGYVYLQTPSLDSALIYFTESLELGKKIGASIVMAKAHDSMGEVFLQKKEAGSCYYHLHRAYQILLELDSKHGLAYTLKNLGAYFDLVEEKDSTEHYYLKSLAFSGEINLVKVQEDVLLKLYLFYKKSGQYPKALAYHELYLAHINKTKGVETQRAIATLEAKYESEKKEREIERLELQAAVQKSRTNAFRVGLLALALVFFFVLLAIFYRRRNERKLFELNQKVLEQEKNELDKELSYKTKQLTAHALHMVQKNKVLQELKSGIADIAKGMDAKSKKSLKSLIRRIDFNIQSDDDWNTFKLYFEETNQNFYENLAKINSNLTTTELKLCALLKLNMNIKETASVLNIEPTSVKTARHRLRKKLDLSSGDDLVVFIRQLA